MTGHLEREVEAIVASIKGSKKYQDTYDGTIRTLVKTEVRRHKTRKQVEKAVRRRLHEIIAFYLGDPDYETAEIELRKAFQSGSSEAVMEICTRVLSSHVSTRERISIADRFYHQVFEVTGKPKIVLDLACALNPLMFSWMGLPETTKYHAYDIHERRVEFINTYFSLQGLHPLAKVQDIALELPVECGDLAFFLKELPRFEKNYGGLGLALVEALRVRYVVVSFPTASAHGGRSLLEHYRSSFHDFTVGRNWPVEEITFENELVFCIDKGSAS